jgi:hypothetical protein
MRILAVNQPYFLNDEVQPLPNSGGINLAEGNRDIFVNYVNPSPGEIEAVQNGKARFWLIYKNGVIILQFRFLAEKTSDKVEGEYAFHVGLYDQEGISCSIEECEEGGHYFFTFALVEHETGLTKALRIFTLGPNFLENFKLLIERQRSDCPDTVNHLARYEEITSKFSANKLRQNAICYCNAGQDSKKVA